MKTMFLPVFSVKAVRFIKICNDKNQNQPLSAGFFFITYRNLP